MSGSVLLSTVSMAVVVPVVHFGFWPHPNRNRIFIRAGAGGDVEWVDADAGFNVLHWWWCIVLLDFHLTTIIGIIVVK